MLLAYAVLREICAGLCASCRAPIGDHIDVLDLADGYRAHLDANYRCLIAWGAQWRSVTWQKSTTTARGTA
jgi:hypothetical protein